MLEEDGGISSFSEAEKDEMYAFLKKIGEEFKQWGK